MPKKMGVNSKSEEARAKKNAAESEKKDRESRQKEEAYWREAGDGAKSRAAKKRVDEAEKKAEAAAKKAEVRRLAELEEKEMEKSLIKKADKKANRVSFPVPKVTEIELRRRKEEEAKKQAEEANKRGNRTAAEEEYESVVLVANTNRDDSIIEARSVEDAIAKISVADNSLLPDKHPERRLKAAFKAFEEAELPRLKEDKPGLTHTQYKDMIWKLWKKSPDNPLNQAAD
jgi:hypothetical protein